MIKVAYYITVLFFIRITGITYLSYVEETNLREELDNRYKRQNVKAQIPDDQVDLVEQIW